MALLSAAAQAAAQTGDPESESYQQVREKLAGAKIMLVPYSHNDFSWFASEAWHWERAALIDERAVEIMRRDENFKWFIDVKLERIDRTAELKPDVLAELKALAKEGRVGIAAGTVANNDNPFNEPEAVIRNMTLGRKFFEREFPEAKLDVACFIDIHPGHTQMPQILSKAGYSYYRFTRPIWALDRKGYKREFTWEGLDGKRGDPHLRALRMARRGLGHGQGTRWISRRIERIPRGLGRGRPCAVRLGTALSNAGQRHAGHLASGRLGPHAAALAANLQHRRRRRAHPRPAGFRKGMAAARIHAAPICDAHRVFRGAREVPRVNTALQRPRRSGWLAPSGTGSAAATDWTTGATA